MCVIIDHKENLITKSKKEQPGREKKVWSNVAKKSRLNRHFHIKKHFHPRTAQ